MKDQIAPQGDLISARFGTEREGDAALKSSQRPISSIVNEIIAHVQEIVRSEVRLAKAEISAKIGEAAKQSLKILAAIVLSLYALGFILLAAMYGLAEIMPFWLAACMVGATIAGIAAFLWHQGRRSMSQIRPRLETTTQTLKENLSWIKKRTS